MAVSILMNRTVFTEIPIRDKWNTTRNVETSSSSTVHYIDTHFGPSVGTQRFYCNEEFAEFCEQIFVQPATRVRTIYTKNSS